MAGPRQSEFAALIGNDARGTMPFDAIQRDPAVVMDHAELARLFAQTLPSETKE